MARVFKRRDRLSAMSEINLTSLMDLVFCLLIIFMLATPLLEQTVAIKLPSTSRDPSLDQPKNVKFQSISVDRAGQVYWGKQPVGLDQLSQLLGQIAQEPDPPVISVRGDADVPYQKVIDVYARVKEAGLTKLDLDTKVQ